MGAPIARDAKGKDFEILDPGTYAAVCTQIIGIGPQETAWGMKEKVKFRFEVPSERIKWEKDGVEQEGPAIVWATYTLSLNDKAILRKDLEAWRGRRFSPQELEAFSLDNVLGAPCMISIVHSDPDPRGKVYDNISSVSRLPKGMPKPEPEGELMGFDCRNYTQEEYNKLAEWQQKLVDAGVENLRRMEEEEAALQAGPPNMNRVDPAPADDGFTDDDIPF